MPEDIMQSIEPEPEPAEPTVNCEHCGAEVPESDASRVLVSTSCLGHLYLDRRIYQQWCDSCREDGAVEVEGIADPVAHDTACNNFYYHESDGSWQTVPEEDEDEDEEGGDPYAHERMLHSYGADVLNIHGWPRRTKRDALAMGVELEMEAVSYGKFEAMLDILGGRDGNGRYILKHDGSLEEGQGAELVTLPYTLDDHKRVFKWDKVLTDSLRAVAKSGAGTSRCGIHIHVNRKAISPLTIGKALVFLNDAKHNEFVTRIAQRSSGSGFCNRDSNKKVSSVRTDEGSRYDILNISGDKTIEFRMFRGNLRPERVLKNLEFVHALIRFCEQSSLSEITRARFVQYVQKNRKTYPFLTGYLVEFNILPEPPERSVAQYAQLARMKRTQPVASVDA